MRRIVTALPACLCLVLLACGGKPPPTGSASTPAPSPAPAAVPAVVPVEPSLGTLEPGQYEWHGRFRGEPFWARLTPDHPDYGGRVLKLVYTPPEAPELGGTHLDSHPWLLLAGDLTLAGWNERSRLSRAEYRRDDQPPGYRVVREVDRMVGDERFTQEVPRSVAGPPGWDRRLAPLLLSLVWRAGSEGAVTLYDFFAADGGRSVLRWTGDEIVIGGETWHAQADAEGRIHRLLDAERDLVLEVEQRLPLVPPAEALERERRFLEAIGAP